jgi:hypothetical protein
VTAADFGRLTNNDRIFKTCGHLWKKQMIINGVVEHYLPNGVCYWTTGKFLSENASKLLPLVDSGEFNSIVLEPNSNLLCRTLFNGSFQTCKQSIWIHRIANMNMYTHSGKSVRQHHSQKILLKLYSALRAFSRGEVR